MLQDWLQRPHIREWWDDGDDTLDKVAAHYSRSPEETKRFLAVVDGVDAGYFQYSRLGPTEIGVDQFLADGGALSQGLGARCLTEFVTLIDGREAPDTISLDPHQSNRRAIRCYEKCGFVHDPAQSDADIYFMLKVREEAI